MHQPQVKRHLSKTQTRQAILAATKQLLRSSGDPGGLSVSVIAQKAHVAVGSIYAHFGSKHALLLAVVGREVGAALEQLDRTIQDASPVAALLAVGDFEVALATQQPVLTRLVVTLRPVAETRLGEHRDDPDVARGVQLVEVHGLVHEAGLKLETRHPSGYATALALYAAWSGICAATCARNQRAPDSAATQETWEHTKRVWLAHLEAAGVTHGTKDSGSRLKAPQLIGAGCPPYSGVAPA